MPFRCERAAFYILCLHFPCHFQFTTAHTNCNVERNITIIESHLCALMLRVCRNCAQVNAANAFWHFPPQSLCMRVYVYRCVNLLAFRKCRIHFGLYRFVGLSLAQVIVDVWLVVVVVSFFSTSIV